MGVLTQRTHDKLSTPRWKALQDLFVQVGEAILEVSPDAQGDLAGTYVKFTTNSNATSAAYAVVWLKVALPKRLIVGLALPEDFEEMPLGPPPERIVYKGLTKFLVIEEGQAFPEGLAGWTKRAYEEALSSDGLQYLLWTGRGREVPKIVPRRGSVVNRSVVEKVPSGWEGVT